MHAWYTVNALQAMNAGARVCYANFLSTHYLQMKNRNSYDEFYNQYLLEKIHKTVEK